MFGTVSAKNLNHGLRYPKEICKNFNNFPIAEYGKVYQKSLSKLDHNILGIHTIDTEPKSRYFLLNK